MSDSHSEPERYSLDEMMERLNKASSNPDTGELVTRADGTQAIKVRKRKRRTDQPKKEKAIRAKRMRVIQVSVLLVLLMLLGLVAGGLFVYSNSAPFRKGLAEKISANTGASSEMIQFRVTPTGANANQLLLKWPEGNMLDSLNLNRLTADIHPSSYLGRIWSGEEATAFQSTLSLRIPAKNGEMRALPFPGDTPTVRFNRFSSNKLDILLNDGDSTPISLVGAEASFYQSRDQSSPELRLNQGALKIAGWPDFELNRASIRFTGKALDVNFLRLASAKDDRGTLELSGKILPYSPEERNALTVSLDSYLINDLLGPMGTLLSGRVDTRKDSDANTFAFSASDKPDATLDISFASSLSSSTLGMNHLPVFANLSRALDDQWFLRPIFETKAIGHLRRGAKSVQITGLDLEHREKLAITGEIFADERGKLTGTLQVGLSSPVISASPTKRLDEIFGPAKAGFRWIEITISGTTGDPRDTFAAILAGEIAAPSTARGEEIGSEDDAASPITPEEMWEEATKSPR